MEWRRFVTYLWNDPRTTLGALMCGGMGASPAHLPKIQHCSPVPKLQLPSQLFVTLASYNKITLRIEVT